ncbi:MAG TPA: hypothetical protein VIJ01_04780, partial [Candidatus Angelobacter sp.]
MNRRKSSSSISGRTRLINLSRIPGILLLWTLLATMNVTAYAQDVEHACNVSGFAHETWNETTQFGHGLKAMPRGVFRPGNLLWELPVLAATGVMIAKVD